LRVDADPCEPRRRSHNLCFALFFVALSTVPTLPVRRVDDELLTLYFFE
jgi:hypothetical protein